MPYTHRAVQDTLAGAVAIWLVTMGAVWLARWGGIEPGMLTGYVLGSAVVAALAAWAWDRIDRLGRKG